MKKIIVVTLACVGLTGCVAVWGRGYNIEAHTKTSITIRFDPSVSKAEDINTLATNYCKQGSMRALAADRSVSVYGLVTIKYECKPVVRR